MLGTNDCRDMFNANPDLIARGMERLARRVAVIDCLGKKPNILLISPAPIKPCVANHWEGAGMGPGCTERSRGLAAAYRRKAEELGCAFFDAAAVAESLRTHSRRSSRVSLAWHNPYPQNKQIILNF